MVSKKKKKLTPVQQEYQELAKKREPSKFTFKNLYRAFLVGGLICLLGQAVQQMFIHWWGFEEKAASSPTVGVMIIISVILTSLGVYDKIAQWAGAGTPSRSPASPTPWLRRRSSTAGKGSCSASAAASSRWPDPSSCSVRSQPFASASPTSFLILIL